VISGAIADLLGYREAFFCQLLSLFDRRHRRIDGSP
jgi:hypothetical protein